MGHTDEPKCTDCEYIADFAGNYVECVRLHTFVDWYWWNSKSPEECPKRQENKSEGEE